MFAAATRVERTSVLLESCELVDTDVLMFASGMRILAEFAPIFICSKHKAIEHSWGYTAATVSQAIVQNMKRLSTAGSTISQANDVKAGAGNPREIKARRPEQESRK